VAVPFLWPCMADGVVVEARNKPSVKLWRSLAPELIPGRVGQFGPLSMSYGALDRKAVQGFFASDIRRSLRYTFKKRIDAWPRN
jgi:hypothetical protein